MCGKTHGVSGGNKVRFDPNDPMSLIEALLNDPNRKRLWEDKPGEYVDPNNPSSNRDPNRGSQPNDPAPPISQPRDPGGPGNQPRDPGGPGTRRPPLSDPTTGGGDNNRPPLNDVYTGGTRTAANDPPRDTYTGGAVSGLTATEAPRDPVTRGTDLLPSGSMLTREQSIAYLAERSPGLSRAMGSFA